MKRLLCILFILLFTGTGFSQRILEPSDTLNKPRFIGVSIANSAVWAGSISALQFVWYKDFDKSPFHFFDDSHEWNQMDKMGHLYTSWQFAGFVDDLYQWSGVNHKKSALLAAGFSFGYMTTFELLDAYNEAWGFSWADVGFNAIGSLTYATQTYLWNEQYVRFKFSFHESGLADYRPNVLGNNFASRTLKDYNGQTYWMSFNPLTWYKNEIRFPHWINLSLGYSTNNQLIGDGGTYVITDGAEQTSFTPYRQYFLSLDIDFQKIPVKSRLLKLALRGVNMLKIPFPALEFSESQVKFHPLYF